jgi:hypothetical protein
MPVYPIRSTIYRLSMKVANRMAITTGRETAPLSKPMSAYKPTQTSSPQPTNNANASPAVNPANNKVVTISPTQETTNSTNTVGSNVNTVA